MRRSHWLLLLFLLVSSLTACAEWVIIKSPEFTDREGRYRVSAPVCWVVHTLKLHEKYGISKDGPLLNWIEIKYSGLEDSFPHTMETIRYDQLISEVAEYYLSEMKEKFKNTTVDHLKTDLAIIDGKPAFKIHFTTTDAKGLEFGHLVYGLVKGDYFYQLSYRAPAIHYFGKELSTFEDMVASFSIL